MSVLYDLGCLELHLFHPNPCCSVPHANVSSFLVGLRTPLPDSMGLTCLLVALPVSCMTLGCLELHLFHPNPCCSVPHANVFSFLVGLETPLPDSMGLTCLPVFVHWLCTDAWQGISDYSVCPLAQIPNIPQCSLL